MERLCCLLWTCCLYVSSVTSVGNTSKRINYYDTLLKWLLDNRRYDKRVPPSFYDEDTHQHTPVVVTVDVMLHRLFGIDDTSEIASAYLLIEEYWTDPRLEWDPAAYANITNVTVSADSIWITDTKISSVTTMNEQDQEDKSMAFVRSDGVVTLVYPALAQEVCPLDLKYFPFDKQRCTFYIVAKANGPWLIAYKSLSVDGKCNLDTQIFQEKDSEWILDNYTLSTYVEEFMHKNTGGIVMRFRVRRQYLYYIINLLFPGIAIALMNTVGLFINVEVEASNMDASALGMTSLLSLLVLLLSVSDQIPKGSNSITLLGSFYIGVILQTMLASFTSLLIRNADRREAIRRLITKVMKYTAWTTKSNRRTETRKSSRDQLNLGSLCLIVNILIIVGLTLAFIAFAVAYRSFGLL